LVEAGNSTAASLPGFEGLTFRKGTIAQWSRDSGVDTVGSSEATPVDILIALHACDTATDDAIFFGIQTGASVILTSPCCHKEVCPFRHRATVVLLSRVLVLCADN
jgi:hypothetical protein